MIDAFFRWKQRRERKKFLNKLVQWAYKNRENMKMMNTLKDGDHLWGRFNWLPNEFDIRDEDVSLMINTPKLFRKEWPNVKVWLETIIREAGRGKVNILLISQFCDFCYQTFPSFDTSEYYILSWTDFISFMDKASVAERDQIINSLLLLS
jgi:hypothetical protein